MSVLAIIPARGGSKGIPLKNVMPLGGRPLLAWSIRQAVASSRVGRVIVSTDSEEIAGVAHDECAEVFWRDASTATDTATTESAVLEVLESLGEEQTEYTVLLQATSPIRQPADIDRAIADLVSCGADSLFSARRVEGYVWRQTLESGLVPFPGARLPRQLRPDTVWEENGSIYVFRTEAFLQDRTRLCGHIVAFEMDPFDSYQIDEYADVQRLEQLIPLRITHACHHTAIA
jgi:CMP-N,N'-diacetyllegionaminic acid synthase